MSAERRSTGDRERFQRGLVVGKFAPLHRGHELLIERALASCDAVVLLSYANPELPGCEPERRERWLAARFPDARRLIVTNAVLERAGMDAEADTDRDRRFASVPADDAPDDVHRRFVAWICHRLLRVEIDAVFTSEAYGDGLAAVLTEEQRRWCPDAAVVRHVAVDPSRSAIPISGTMIRADVHACRAWLAPEVYASFIRRVCLLGGESSGKTTLGIRLAEALGTAYVAEYGRELWERRGGVLTFEDMLHIGERQVALEDSEATHAREFLICDTSPLTTAFYSHAMFGRVDPALERLAAERRYDLTVLCAPDFAFVQDGTRQDSSFRLRQHEWYLTALAERGDAWMLATGSVDERVSAVCEALRCAPAAASRP